MVVVDYLVFIGLGFPETGDVLGLVRCAQVLVFLLQLAQFSFERSLLRDHCVHLGLVFALPNFAFSFLLGEVLANALIFVDKLLVSAKQRLNLFLKVARLPCAEVGKLEVRADLVKRVLKQVILLFHKLDLRFFVLPSVLLRRRVR